MNRKDILLRAAYDLIKRSSQNYYVESATDVCVFYDDATCDGWCLMDDICNELELDDDEQPIPIKEDE